MLNSKLDVSWGPRSKTRIQESTLILRFQLFGPHILSKKVKNRPSTTKLHASALQPCFFASGTPIWLNLRSILTLQITSRHSPGVLLGLLEPSGSHPEGDLVPTWDPTALQNVPWSLQKVPRAPPGTLRERIWDQIGMILEPNWVFLG